MIKIISYLGIFISGQHQGVKIILYPPPSKKNILKFILFFNLTEQNSPTLVKNHMTFDTESLYSETLTYLHHCVFRAGPSHGSRDLLVLSQSVLHVLIVGLSGRGGQACRPLLTRDAGL